MRIIDLTTAEERAESAQPSGYNAHRITEPPAAREEALAEIDTATESVGMVRLLLDAGRLDRHMLEQALAATARALRGARGAIASGAAVLALAAAAILLPVSTPAAQAAEGPEPDPTPAPTAAAAVYPVVLDRAFPTVTIRATTRATTPSGLHCASVWATSARPLQLGPGLLGHACSYSRTVPVRATLDGRALPLGRTRVSIVDDADPLGSLPQTAFLDARRPSRFGVGTWTDAGQGYLVVAAPIRMYSPAAARWLPQQQAPVQVQELTRRGWRVRATLTSRNGVAYGTLYLGPGAHTVRVARPAGATVWATTGTTRRIDLLTEPLGVI
jgi:hypothetical protein